MYIPPSIGLIIPIPMFIPPIGSCIIPNISGIIWPDFAASIISWYFSSSASCSLARWRLPTS
jgi:hypothetical protein